MEEITYEFKIKTPKNEFESTMNTLIMQLETLKQYVETDCYMGEFAIENQNMLIDRMKTNLNNLKYKEVE